MVWTIGLVVVGAWVVIGTWEVVIGALDMAGVVVCGIWVVVGADVVIGFSGVVFGNRVIVVVI